jgi:hypothetical protein
MKKMAKEIERLNKKKSQTLQATADARTTQVKELGNHNRTLKTKEKGEKKWVTSSSPAASELEARCKQFEARQFTPGKNPGHTRALQEEDEVKLRVKNCRKHTMEILEDCR